MSMFIPEAAELTQRFEKAREKALELFDGNAVMKRHITKACSMLVAHVKCMADPLPADELYIAREDGTIFVTRGTNINESFHAFLNRCIPRARSSRQHMEVLLFLVAHAWNLAVTLKGVRIIPRFYCGDIVGTVRLSGMEEALRQAIDR